MYVGTLIPLLGVQYLGSAQVLRKGLDKQWRRSWLVLDSIKKSLVFLDSRKNEVFSISLLKSLDVKPVPSNQRCLHLRYASGNTLIVFDDFTTENKWLNAIEPYINEHRVIKDSALPSPQELTAEVQDNCDDQDNVDQTSEILHHYNRSRSSLGDSPRSSPSPPSDDKLHDSYSSLFKCYQHSQRSPSERSFVEPEDVVNPQSPKLITANDPSSDSESGLAEDFRFPSRGPSTENALVRTPSSRRRAVTDPLLTRPPPLPTLPAATASDEALRDSSNTFLGNDHKVSLTRKARTAIAAPYRKLSDFSERGSDVVQKFVGPLLTRRPAKKWKATSHSTLWAEQGTVRKESIDVPVGVLAGPPRRAIKRPPPLNRDAFQNAGPSHLAGTPYHALKTPSVDWLILSNDHQPSKEAIFQDSSDKRRSVRLSKSVATDLREVVRDVPSKTGSQSRSAFSNLRRALTRRLKELPFFSDSPVNSSKTLPVIPSDQSQLASMRNKNRPVLEFDNFNFEMTHPPAPSFHHRSDSNSSNISYVPSVHELGSRPRAVGPNIPVRVVPPTISPIEVNHFENFPTAILPPVHPAPPVVPRDNHNDLETLVVRRRFFPISSDELSVTVGEAIAVIATFGDGWAHCINSRGQEGLVPINCFSSQGSSGSVSGLQEPPDLTGQLEKCFSYPSVPGGYADVWIALWNQPVDIREKTPTKRVHVGVKVIRLVPDDLRKKHKVSKALKRELLNWQKAKHVRILPLWGICDDFGPYTSMVSPWLKNGNITSYLRAKKPAGRLLRLRLLCETAEGLQYLHSIGMIHGDLKGANVLVDDNGQACLCDFGLSRVIEAAGASAITSTFAGSVRWMAPELLGMNDLPIRTSKRTDVYSLGRVALELLTGEIPYHYIGNEAQVVMKVVKGVKPSRPSTFQVTQVEWDCMLRCWSIDPDTRPDVDVLLKSFQEFYQQSNYPITLHI